MEIILVIEERGGKVGAQDGTKVAGGEGVVAGDESIGDTGVEGVAKLYAKETKQGQAIATARMNHFDNSRGTKPRAQGRIGARQDRRNAANVEHMDWVGRRRVGRCGRDANLKKLNEAGELQIAFKIDGKNARVGGVGEKAVEGSKGSKGNVLIRMVGRAG